jgi:hypothetical protein
LVSYLSWKPKAVVKKIRGSEDLINFKKILDQALGVFDMSEDGCDYHNIIV